MSQATIAIARAEAVCLADKRHLTIGELVHLGESLAVSDGRDAELDRRKLHTVLDNALEAKPAAGAGGHK